MGDPAHAPGRQHAGAVARAPEGFCHQPHRGSDFRAFVRGVKIAGRTLRQRYARLHAVIDDFDRCVALFAKRLAVSKAKAPVMAFAMAEAVSALCGPLALARDSS